MEKMLVPKHLLNQLPIGYMITIQNSDKLPDNFMYVDGQTLSKKEYNSLFMMMKNNVTECGDYFTLPTRENVENIFKKISDNNSIIIKVK